MNLALAYVKSESKVCYKNFEVEEGKTHILDIEDLQDKEVHGIFLNRGLLESEEKTQLLNEKLSQTVYKSQKYAPIRPLSQDQLNADSFEHLTPEAAKAIIESTYSTWSLKNNLSLVENMMEQIDHLKPLFPNDRTTFFEELWHILRSNLGATSLTLAYNHLQKAEKENEKNKLVRVVIEGSSKPNPTENQELGEALFKNYEGKFQRNFEVYSYNEESGEVVFLAQVNESPVIIMAKVFGLTALQRATFNCLFEGLSRK